MNSRFNVTGAFVLVACFTGPAAAAEEVRIKNPYDGLNWAAIQHYKANFHSHTVKSDGRAEPETLIEAYAGAGYDILAITDHDNHYTRRSGERDPGPTAETTWPWTRWIDHEPSENWELNGIEIAAFYPDLGETGMLAVRGNELTHHPHIQSLFNTAGWERGEDATDDERMQAVEDQQGIAYWAHPTDYVPGGRWQNRVFESSWEDAVRHLGLMIVNYDRTFGIEMQLNNRRERDEELFDRLLREYYAEHDIFVNGADDNHQHVVHETASLTIVLAEELTAPAVRHALENGHLFVGTRNDRYPPIQEIVVNEEAETITVRVPEYGYDRIRWIKDGEPFGEGPRVDFSDLEDTPLRFELDLDDATFYSQGFYIY